MLSLKIEGMDGQNALKFILLMVSLWSRTLVANDFSFLLDTESSPLYPISKSSLAFSTETESREGIEQEIIYIHRPGQGKERISKKALRDFTQAEKFAWLQFYDSTTMMPTRAGSFEERFEQTINLLPHDKYLSTVDISSLSGMAAYEGFRRAVIDRENSGHCPTLIDPKPRTPVLPIDQRDGAIKLGICPFLSTEDQARLLEEFKQTYLKTSNRFTFLEFITSSAFALEVEILNSESGLKPGQIDPDKDWATELAEKDLCLGNSQSTVDAFHRDYVEGRATLQQIAQVEKGFDASRANEAHYRETLADAVAIGEASIQDLQNYDNQVLQIEEKRQAFEHLTKTGDDHPLRKLRAPTEAEMAETEIIRSTAIATIRETNPDFVVGHNIIDADGRVETRESTADEYTKNGSTLNASGSSDKKDYSGIKEEEERVSLMASDILVEGKRRGVDITEERALDMAQRLEKTAAKTVHYDDIFKKGVDQSTTEADYEDYAKESRQQLKDHYEARKISRELNSQSGADRESPAMKELEERLAILKKQIEERKEKIQQSKKLAEDTVKERKQKEQREIASNGQGTQKRQSRRRAIQRNEGQLAAGGGQPQRRFPGNLSDGGGGSRTLGGSGGGGSPKNLTSNQSDTKDSQSERSKKDSTVAEQSTGPESTRKSNRGSDYPGVSTPAKVGDGKGPAEKEKERSVASIGNTQKSPEKSNTKSAIVNPKEGEKPKVAVVPPEILKRIASFSFKKWEDLSAEEKQMYQEYFQKVFALLDLSKIDFDLKKLREKYVTIGGDKVFIDKAALLEIEDPAVFTAFLLNVLMENPTMTALYLRDGAKAQKLSFHHTTEQDMGFAIRAFSEGFEEISTTKNFERMMLLRVYSDEAKAVAKNTSNGEANGSQN